LISSQPAFLLHAYTADSNFKLMHILYYVTTVQPLANGPYVVLFDLKSLNKDGNWQACMFVLYACAKRSLRSPQNTLQSM